MNVHYPHMGHIAIMRWSQECDGTHLALARNSNILFRTASSIFKKRPYAKVREVFEAELVNLPEFIDRRVAEERRKAEYNDFAIRFAGLLNDLAEAKKPLPPEFSICSVYEHSDNDAVTETEDEHHFDCCNCVLKIRVGNKAALHAKYAEAAYVAGLLDRPRTFGQPCCARIPSYRESIMMASADFGHHRAGVYINPLKDLLPESIANTSVLFFFVRGNTLDQKPYELISRTSRQAARQAAREEMLGAQRQRKQAADDLLRNTVQFFKKVR
jgi:hypothetical protein